MPDLFLDQLLSRGRQIDFKSRTVPFLTVDIDDAAVIFDNTICAGKAQAGSAANGLGGKKGFKYSLLGCFVHTDASV